MSDYFQNAWDFKITGGNFSHVVGDQTNIRTMIENVVIHVEETSQAKEVDVESETLELSEFHEVKRADIRILKEIARHTAKDRQNERRNKRRLHYYWDEDPPDKRTGDCDHIIYTAELNVVGPLVQGSKFTVKTYHGPYALEDWREDFSRCSQVVQTGVFGYNRSKIPSLIVSGELVPVAHILDTGNGAGGKFFKEFYIRELTRHLGGCRPSEVWIDPSRGVLCRGPVGPECEVDIRIEGFEVLPSDIDFLKEDVFLRFVASGRSRSIDGILVWKLAQKHREEDSTVHRVDRPTVITPSNKHITLGPLWWRAGFFSCLGGGTELENGLTRFTLEGGEEEVYLYSSDFYQGQAWLTQASGILQGCGVSVNDDLSQYKLITTFCELKGRLSKPQECCPEQIYFFISPSPPLASCTTGDVHYWSLDPDGQSPISPDTCHLFGLPTELELTVIRRYAYSWPSEVYQMIRKYQVARGFDPSTPDFACYLKYPIYRPARNDSNRFNDIGQDANTSSLWLKMKSLFSPTVSDDSDILTVGF